MRFIAFVSVLFGLLITTANPAVADCEGPTIEVEQREVVRGGQLVVTGYAWGDNCYDTSPPPDGEGALGVPIDEITIYVVQGTDDFIVATGAADADYSFDVTIVIPAELTAGTATVQARWAADRIAYSENPEIVVTDAAPLVSDEPAVARFEPNTTTTTTAVSTTAPTVAPTSAPASTAASLTESRDPIPDDAAPADQDSNTITAPVLGGVAALGVCLLAVLIVRRRIRTHDPTRLQF